MKFSYTAKKQTGDLQTGIVEAGSREAAVATLQGYGLVVLRVQEEEARPWYLQLFAGIGHAGLRDMAIFTRQFATLLEAQVPLIESLRTLFQQAQNVYLKDAVFEVISDVESGSSLSQAFSRHENVFSRFYIQMVRSAEMTGRLQEVFTYLSDYYESQASLSSKVKSALIYPAFVFGLFAVVLTVMVVVVIPQLSRIFLDLETDPSRVPLVTKLLFGLGGFTQQYGWAILAMFIAAVVVLRLYFRSEEGRALLESSLIATPVIGSIARKIYLAQFAETLSVMISGDIPVGQALEVSGDVVGNIAYQESILESAEAVRRGELVSEALSRFPDKFPPLVVQMVAIGEKTGRMDELLGRAAKFYSREVERAMTNITELIQPVMIVVLGVFVGLLIGAVILPIYQIAQSL